MVFSLVVPGSCWSVASAACPAFFLLPGFSPAWWWGGAVVAARAVAQGSWVGVCELDSGCEHLISRIPVVGFGF